METTGSPPRPLRGQIWEFDLRSRGGREQRGVRPCLVVSTDGLNRSRFGTVIVCPVTTIRRPSFLWRVGLEPADLLVVDPAWTPAKSWIQTDQIVTLDSKKRARRHLCTVASRARMEAVDDSLRLMLGL